MSAPLHIKYSVVPISTFRLGHYRIDPQNPFEAGGPIRFGPYTVDIARHVLEFAGRELHLEPRGFELLAYLIERRDRVVSKAELLDALWPSIHVSESVVARCVMKVRAVLGTPGRKSDTIRTVHRIGYRFTADATRISRSGLADMGVSEVPDALRSGSQPAGRPVPLE
jgi:DNA-binding winged helix-turn-helix (wHTH) protein